MKFSFLLTAVIVLGSSVCASAQVKQADPGILGATQTWTFLPGAEFPPGGAGSFSLSTEGNIPIGVLAYDFSNGGAYVAGQTPVDIAEGNSAFHIRAKAPQPLKLAIRLVDSTKQVHQTNLAYTDAGQWQSFRIDLKEKAALVFGGPKDGVIHYPIKFIWIIVSKTDPAGEVHFSNAEFVK